MSKAEQSPPFKMIVQGGRLAPAAAWDAERLASYRNGSTVNVAITQEKAGWRQRKYWAILNAVVKTCPVRQRRAEDLHKAIRLKLGVVDSFTTFGGATKVELRSTSTMGEQEFEAFYFEAMDLLRQETGVDIETLGKEAADVGLDDREQNSAAVMSPAPADGSGEAAPSQEPAPDHSASPAGETIRSTQDEAIDAAPATGQSPVGAASPQPNTAAADPAPVETAPPTGSSGADTLSDDDRAYLIDVFKRMSAAVGEDVNVLKTQALIYADTIKSRSELVRKKATTIREQLEECCGEQPKSHVLKATKYIAGLIGADEKELLS